MSKSSPTIETMPMEVMNEITQLLDWTDLKALTLSSKRVNNVVSSSTKALAQVRFMFNTTVSEVRHVRKFTRFLIEACDDEDLRSFQRIFEDMLGNVREISFGPNFFSLSSLFDVLALCKMIKVIDFDYFQMIGYKDEDTCDVALSLDKLTIESITPLMKHLKKFTVKQLKIQNVSEKRPKKHLKEFLAAQTQLQSLYLRSGMNFNAIIDSARNFKLKSLTLHNCSRLPGLRGFLTTQSECLENVELIGVITLPFINCFVILQKNFSLKLDMTSFWKHNEIPAILSNVLKLEMTCENMRDSADAASDDLSALDGQYPNLRGLKVTKFGNFAPQFPFELLERLTLDRCTIKGPLNFPKIKDLKFLECTFDIADENPFDFSQHSLENLEVIDCSPIAWIYRFLQHEGTKLKILKLHIKTGTDEHELAMGQKIVIENMHKVKHMEFN